MRVEGGVGKVGGDGCVGRWAGGGKGCRGRDTRGRD